MNKDLIIGPIAPVKKMSSEGEEYLDSADVNEEFSLETTGEEEGEENIEEEEEEGYDDEDERQKYSEDLEFEDVGEPATFNFNVHSGEPVYSVDFLQGTEFLASGGGDDRALLIDARGLEVLADLGKAGDSMISVRFFQGSDGYKSGSSNSSDSSGRPPVLLATASMDGSVRVYESDPEQGIVLKCKFEGPGEGVECNWIDWHSRGPVLIAGFADGSVWMWNVALVGSSRDPLMSIFAGHVSTPVTIGEFTPDGKTVLIGSAEGVLLAYEARDSSNPVLKIVPQTHQSTALHEITHLAVHPTKQIFMAGDAEGHLRVYKSTSPGDEIPIFDLSALHTASIESLAFHPLGNLAVSAAMDGQAIIYDSHSTYQPRHKINSKDLFFINNDNPLLNVNPLLVDNPVDNCGFTLAKWLASMPNGPSLPTPLNFGLLLGTSQGLLAIVEGRSGLLLRRLKGRPGRPVLDASVSVNGILAVAFDDGIISLYQL